MKWTDLPPRPEGIGWPDGYRLARMRGDQVEPFVDHLRGWFPEIAVGEESRFLDPSFYAREIFPADVPVDERRFLPLLFEVEATGEVAGWLFVEKHDRAETVSSPMAGLAPAHRHGKTGLSRMPPILIEVVGRAIGAGMAFSYVTLAHAGAQRVAELAGYACVGIAPAFDVDMVRPGVQGRVFEALYAKVLAPPDRLHVPAEDDLTPAVRALWTFLYPDRALR